MDLKTYQPDAAVKSKSKTSMGVHADVDFLSLKPVTGADNLTSNGVAHFYDEAMLPQQALLTDLKTYRRDAAV